MPIQEVFIKPTDEPSHMRYRADIDGLRAIAILSVVLYHALPTFLTGGFVGVDVFFVISGFLISGNIARGLAAKTFTFRDFYRRRVLRIFPALIVILAVAMGAGFLICFSAEYARLGEHVAAGAAFAANFLLWHEAGYFDLASELKPLLHLWSLAIEEQFYIIWPVILLLAWRRRMTLCLILIVLLSSFALNIYLIQSDPTAAFYLPMARFWELMAGALVAILVNGQRRRSWPEFSATLGLSLILAAAFFLTKGDAFPGWWALLPVGGAMLLLYSGPFTSLHRLLSKRGFVWLGKISYPLYLWHWPLFSFVRILLGHEPSLGLFLLLTAVAVLAAWLTYRLVELPLQRQPRTYLAPLLTGLLVVCGLVGGAIYRFHGVPGRFAGNGLLDPQWTYPVHDPDYESDELAQQLYGAKFDSVRDFFIIHHGEREAAPLVMIGDSHAHRIFHGLVEAGVNQKSLQIFSRGTCPGLWHTDVLQGAYPANCQPFADRTLQYLVDHPAIRVVLINAYYKNYLGSATRLVATGGEKFADNAAIFAYGLEQTIGLLQRAGKQVVLILDVPHFPFSILSCLQRPLVRLQSAASCTMPKAEFMEQQKEISLLTQELGRRMPGLVVLDPAPVFCDGDICAAKQEVLLYMDDGNHLSNEGAHRLGRYLAPRIEEIIGRQH